MNQIDFTYRRALDTDFDQLRELHKRCLDNLVDQDYFVWKYKNNPAGEAIGFVACDGDTIAGFYGVIPETFIVNEKEVTIFQSMDTMTNPDYQKRGLFTKLAQITYNYLIEKSGTTYIYGFAGPSSLPGFVSKLNWQLVYSVPYIFLNKYQFNLQNIFTRSAKEIEIRETKFSSLDLDSMQTSIASESPIHPKLSNSFLRWRVEQKPKATYRTIAVHERGQLVGWAVITLEGDGRCKIEYLCMYQQSHQYHARQLIGFLFRSYNIKFIYTWKPTTNRVLHHTYQKLGFVSNPFSRGPFSYQVPFILYSNAEVINEIKWFDKANFDIQPLLQD